MSMSTQWLSDLVQDIQIAVRTLRRRPVVAIVPVLSSALGISACSLVVGIANMALYLVSDPGKHVTGQAISVCAGVEMLG